MIHSPCIGVCTLVNDVCVGCYRTKEQIGDWLHYTKEKVWRECDKKTRETRLLTKEISVIDMANFSIFGGDSRFYKCLGEASKLSAIYYPQLLGKTILINTPSYFRFLYKKIMSNDPIIN